MALSSEPRAKVTLINLYGELCSLSSRIWSGQFMKVALLLRLWETLRICDYGAIKGGICSKSKLNEGMLFRSEIRLVEREILENV